MNESFRPRKSIQTQGICYTLLFLFAAIGYASFAFLDEPAKRGFESEGSAAKLAALGGAFFGGMTLLGVYLLVAYYFERVAVAGTTISVDSVFRKRQFDTAAVDKLIWMTLTRTVGGRIDFHVAGQRTKVELYDYSENDRVRMIRLFRGLIPEEKQADWPMFCHKIALPLRDKRVAPLTGDLAPPLGKGEVIITRRRYDRLAAVVVPVSLVLALAFWWATTLPVLLAMPPFLVFVWLFARFSTRREGERAERLTATPRGRVALFVQVLMFGSLGLYCVLTLAGVRSDIARAIPLLVVAAASPFIARGLHRAVKDEKHKTETAAAAAPAQWSEGELVRLHSQPG